jgi:hypothetical protein
MLKALWSYLAQAGPGLHKFSVPTKMHRVRKCENEGFKIEEENRSVYGYQSEVSPEARYKAIMPSSKNKKRGLAAFKSADGINWSLVESNLVITEVLLILKPGFPDSTNKCTAYWRIFYKRRNEIIQTATSKDFIHREK